MILRRWDTPAIKVYILVLVTLFLLSFTAYRSYLESATEKVIRADALQRSGWSSNESGSQRELVIIATESRSGSTWLGTIFQMIPDLLYVFEPLDPVYTSLMGFSRTELDSHNRRQLSEESKLKVLLSLCTCKFQTIQAFGKAAATRITSSHTLYNLHEEVKKGQDHMEEFCSQFSVVMPKCIRLPDISILKQLPELGCTRFKVVHLIRDPRAVIRSRMDTRIYPFQNRFPWNPVKLLLRLFSFIFEEFGDDEIYKAAADLCSNIVNYRAIAKQPWLKDRYMAVHYQDIVDKPYEKLEELYRFVNKPVTDKVTEFVATSMNGKKTSSDFNVIKDSVAVSEKWHDMDVNKIHIIENACSAFFQTFDYQLFDGKI